MSGSKHFWDMTPTERLDEFEKLEKGWDSYGGHPIDPRAIAEARRLLESWPGDLPTPVPLSSGGISLEFKDENDYPLVILPDGSVEWEEE